MCISFQDFPVVLFDKSRFGKVYMMMHKPHEISNFTKEGDWNFLYQYCRALLSKGPVIACLLPGSTGMWHSAGI
jgi:hypothetical protein